MNTTCTSPETLSAEKIKRGPLRPLGPVSNFVVEKIPFLLEDLDYQMDEENIEFLTSTGIQHVENLSNVDVRQKALAHLDSSILFEFASTLLTTKKTRDDLFDLLEATSAASNSIKGMTYEGLILANPLTEDPRTFLKGEEGKEEILFYTVHLRIETEIAGVLKAFHDVLANGNSNEVNDFCFDSIIPLIKYIRSEMEFLTAELQESTFDKMAPFFRPSKERGIRGPSGLYSAGIFCLDAYMVGNMPAMQQFLEYKMSERNYYPSSSAQNDAFSGQTDMDQALEIVTKGKTLHDLNLPNAMNEVASQMHAMRKTHFGLASKFIIKRMGEGAKGSAGTKIRQFLQIPLNLYLSLTAKQR